MLNHTLQPLEVSAWPDDLRQALERGLDDPKDIPTWGTSRRSTSPTSGGSESSEPVEPGGVAGGDARSGNTGPPPKMPLAPERDQPVPPQNLDTEEGKLSLLLWDEEAPRGATDVWGDLEEALQRRNPKGADQQFKLSPQKLLALERRTHPLTCERDHIDPIIYSVYSAWTTFPLVVKTQRRGRSAEGSASDKWMGNILQMRKEAVPFLESLGIPKPRSKAEWSYILKEIGTFLAAKNFIVNCPLPVMELPVATTARRPCVSGRSVTSASRSRCHH